MVRISVSSNPENENDLVDYVKLMQSIGADFMHMDVMDGNFVEQSCLNSKLVGEVRKNSVIPLDVHLMVENPTKHILPYIASGANIITVHYENYVVNEFETKINEKLDIKRMLEDVNLIRRTNHTLVGLSFKPITDVEDIIPLLVLFDLVLVMSVVPGLSGQKFLEDTYLKIERLRQVIDEKELSTLIEVDGGITKENANKVAQAGADILVMGSAMYQSEDKIGLVNYIHKIKK